MKKVIEGSVYNTETAKKVCEQSTKEVEHEKGAEVQKQKQLFKTKSGKYFFFIKNEFPGYVDVNNDDLNPKFEKVDLVEEKIIPVSYEVALQFASEIASEDSESKKMISKFFPELIGNDIDESIKIQKKIYLSEKANWYLEMMLTVNNDTNSSIIEKLIMNEYRRLYSKGIMVRDPYFEMED
ncbi:hypothetical protein [Bacillus niameyensis]|uniref:hypothetical protein n=1 Tax=Bacillus niameyensis TaxID=1522308 RepID=UPI0007855796|nr:hypothetical protein [Bacillus niameyensis]